MYHLKIATNSLLILSVVSISKYLVVYRKKKVVEWSDLLYIHFPACKKQADAEDNEGTHCAAETQLSVSSTPEEHFKLRVSSQPYSVVKQTSLATFTHPIQTKSDN